MTTMYDMEDVEKYNLHHVIEIDDSNENQNKRTPYYVTCIMSNEKFICSCMMFELRSHVLKILICLRTHRIPKYNILKH